MRDVTGDNVRLTCNELQVTDDNVQEADYNGTLGDGDNRAW